MQNTVTGEIVRDRQCPIVHEGSFSTSIIVRIAGNRVECSGNPSRFNRLDNFEGFRTIVDCVSVFNSILSELGLPLFSRCTKIWLGKADRKGKFPIVSDGAAIKEIHVTSNQANGKGRAVTVIRALSTLRYRNSLPHLFVDNNSVCWQSKLGKSRLVRPIVYNKAVEMSLHLLPKVKRVFGDKSDEYLYVKNLMEYCYENGITRHEVNLKAEWLARNNCKFWGLFNENKLGNAHEEFLQMQSKLQVNHLDVEDVSAKLLRLGVCSSVQSANSTSLYYSQWLHGSVFDFLKTQVRTHRARLRKIGVDIANPCDLTKYAAVHVVNSEAVISRPAIAPSWYRHPQRPVGLKLVA